jgi:hypothetical protein
MKSAVAVKYLWNKAYVTNKCLRIKGVSAKWSSGAESNIQSITQLCSGITRYQVSVPYQGNEQQLTIDGHVGWQHQQELARRQAEHDAAMYMIGTALINSVAALSNAYYAPVSPPQPSHPIQQPTPPPPSLTTYQKQKQQEQASQK